MQARKQPRYRFRPGALEAIMRSRNVNTDAQLALLIGVHDKDLEKIRAGWPVTAEVALRVSALQGDQNYIAAWFDQIDEPAA